MDVTLIRHRRRHHKQSGGLLALRFALIVLITLLFSGIVFSLLGIAVAAGVYASFVSELPSAEEIGRRSVESFETTRIYDRTGQHLLLEIIPNEGGRRTEVPLSQVPAHLRNATIAMEDKTFYTNLVGINVEGVARAVWGELTGADAGGGSSIPQQLIRNVIMTPEERMERSYERKLKEMVLANELTRRYPGIEGRDKILEWYLNAIFYGHFAYGVEAAAQTYFHKHVQDLTLAEAAMIVPLGQRPALNPIDHPDEAKKRQEIVLDQMYLQGYITAQEALAAKQEPIVVAPPSFDIVAPHYVLYVRQLLEERFGTDAVYGGGLQVISAVDLDVQKNAEEIVRENVKVISEKYDAHNAAAVVMNAKTAEIIAIVGSADYFDKAIDGQVNIALVRRQPGSSFKPYVYATAFAQGYTPATMVMDVRTSFATPDNMPPYVPENYTRTYHGPVLLRQALACSLNIPAVAMAQKVGLDKVVATARAMGISTLTEANYGLALALGGTEITLMDHIVGYSVFANGGTMLGDPIPPERFRPGFRQLDPVAILKVTDAKGNVLYEYKEPQKQKVISPEVAYLITHILSDNEARTPELGPNSALLLKDRPAAAKTGSTNNFHDAWTMGYTPQYVVGVWAGNTDYTEMKNAPGSRTAAPIWNGIMEYLHKDLPVEGFVRPAGLKTCIIDSVSGKLPTEYSPSTRQEVFIEGTVPTASDDIHIPFRICQASGKLASAYCPPEQVTEQVFEIYPSDAEDWVREKEIPQPPADYCDIHGPNLASMEIAISSPRALQPTRGMVTIIGSARPGGMEKYWLQYGEGMSPTAWTPVGPEHGNRVDNNVLENWDTIALNGLYTLRLNVAVGGGVQQYDVQVMLDNTPPKVQVVAPAPEQIYRVGEDEWLSIQVEAIDNIDMDKVEVFLDDQPLGFSTVAPYVVRWMWKDSKIPVIGTHSVYVIATDAAGNTTQTEPFKVKVEEKKK
jgi:penicillin-binding protein 1C